jgi:hypothetical protein
MQQKTHTRHRYRPVLTTETIGSDGNLWRITTGVCTCRKQKLLAAHQVTKQVIRN